MMCFTNKTIHGSSKQANTSKHERSALFPFLSFPFLSFLLVLPCWMVHLFMSRLNSVEKVHLKPRRVANTSLVVNTCFRLSLCLPSFFSFRLLPSLLLFHPPPFPSLPFPSLPFPSLPFPACLRGWWGKRHQEKAVAGARAKVAAATARPQSPAPRRRRSATATASHRTVVAHSSAPVASRPGPCGRGVRAAKSPRPQSPPLTPRSRTARIARVWREQQVAATPHQSSKANPIRTAATTAVPSKRQKRQRVQRRRRQHRSGLPKARNTHPTASHPKNSNSNSSSNSNSNRSTNNRSSSGIVVMGKGPKAQRVHQHAPSPQSPCQRSPGRLPASVRSGRRSLPSHASTRPGPSCTCTGFAASPFTRTPSTASPTSSSHGHLTRTRTRTRSVRVVAMTPATA